MTHQMSFDGFIRVKPFQTQFYLQAAFMILWTQHYVRCDISEHAFERQQTMLANFENPSVARLWRVKDTDGPKSHHAQSKITQLFLQSILSRSRRVKRKSDDILGSDSPTSGDDASAAGSGDDQSDSYGNWQHTDEFISEN